MNTAFIYFIFVLVFFCDKCNGYSWIANYQYAVSSCASSSVVYVLLQQMNKCYQVSDSDSTMSTCTLTPGTTGSFQKQVITWNNNDCSGNSATNVLTTVTTQCLGGNTFSCIDNSSEVETWPGIGTWQPDADNGLGASCSYKCGPQFVDAYPPTCMNNGMFSWIYSCDSTTITYNYFQSVNCNVSTIMTAQTEVYPIDTCFSYGEQMGYGACTVTAIPGTSFLTFSDSQSQGDVQTDKLSAGVVAAVVLIVLTMVSCLAVSGWYFMRRYDITKREVGGRSAADGDGGTELKSIGKSAAAEHDSTVLAPESSSPESVSALAGTVAVLAMALTCGCCNQGEDALSNTDIANGVAPQYRRGLLYHVCTCQCCHDDYA